MARYGDFQAQPFGEPWEDSTDPRVQQALQQQMGGQPQPTSMTPGRSNDFVGPVANPDRPERGAPLGDNGQPSQPATEPSQGAQSAARFGGTNWEGLTRSGGGGAFQGSLSGFDVNKLNDPTGQSFSDANTSKYMFGSIAQNYDPRDPQALEKITAELNAMGIPATFDGKDKIDFGDGYGFIDVLVNAEKGKGGDSWAWQPGGGGAVGGASQGGAAGVGAVGLPQGADLSNILSMAESDRMQYINDMINRLIQNQEPPPADLMAQMRG